MRVSGSCHCGEIAFEADVEPGSAIACHCRDCQQLTGTAFRAAIPAGPETFRLVRGTPSIYLKIADSGSARRHAFCGTCGSPVFRMPTGNNPNYALRLGTLDPCPELGRPKLQQWTRSRMPWLAELGEIAAFDRQTDLANG